MTPARDGDRKGGIGPMVTILLAGDVMLGRGVNAELARMAPEEPWGTTLPLWLEADLRVINLECAITAHRRPWERTYKVFHFRADPRAVDVLRAARVDACSLANNHTLDFEVEGLLDTLRHLDAAGIAHAGAGRDLQEARRPAVLEVRDSAGTRIRVGLVAFTDNEPDFGAGPDRPGTNYLPVCLDDEILGTAERAIAAARSAGADLVIFSSHWGPNMVVSPPPHFRAFARAVIDRGADIYYGHSAHVFQGVEVYRKRLILYDTGDFLDDYAVDPVLRNDWSFLFRIECGSRGPERLILNPVALSFARTDLATGAVREAILSRMEHLSGALGTRLTRNDGRLELMIGAEGSATAGTTG